MKKMIKLVLDTNIIDRCYALNLTREFFDNLGCEIWVPTYVKNEIFASKNKKLIAKLEELRHEETGFFWICRQP